MKHILFAGLTTIVMLFSCGNKQKDNSSNQDSLRINVTDTAFYGNVGKSTSMHSIEMTDENGNSSSYVISDEEAVIGGVFAGDRITLTAFKNSDDELEITKLINLTSLCGKWTSLDRNFEIKEDGTVESHQAGETKPYTQWSMVNCNIVLNVDTFSIDYIGPDSLTLENSRGIFVYKRLK